MFLNELAEDAYNESDDEGRVGLADGGGREGSGVSRAFRYML